MITAAILAGQRPGSDPLTTAYGGACKALIPVAGAPMVAHALRTILAHPRIGRVLLLAQDTQMILAGLGDAALAGNPQITAIDGPSSIAQAVAVALKYSEGPLLVTTADHVLLSHDMIDAMLASGAADIAVGMVERRTLLARYPQSKRTWLKFREGWWSGANLFWLTGGERLTPLLDFWTSIEQDRKKGWRILTAFGPWLAIGAVLRFWTIDQAIMRAGRRFGLSARVIALAEPEACIDVDKPADKILVEEILERDDIRLHHRDGADFGRA